MALISDNIRELRVGMQSYETVIISVSYVICLYITNRYPDIKK